MRLRFEQQLKIGQISISEVTIPFKTRDHLPPLLKALQEIYTDTELNEKISNILYKKISKGKKTTGKLGMSLWEIFVLAQVRLCLNCSYDRLHHMANYDTLLRSILGVETTDYSIGKQYEYQNIYDNVTLLEDQLLKEINSIIVSFGHKVLKKETAALRIKADTFVLESNVHFPTDINLLWDSGRKCLDAIEYIIEESITIKGWRKLRNWHTELKKKMRNLSKACSRGGINKEECIKRETDAYLNKAKRLSKKVNSFVENQSAETESMLIKMIGLLYFKEMLEKHIDLVERRLLKGEKIPHEEKMFSIFETYTEWITKGKLRPNVELGKKVLICTDQYNLIIDWEIAENQADVDLSIPMVDRLLRKYIIESLSFDKGFWNKENNELLQLYIPEVVMPKKGKPSKEERELQNSSKFKKLMNQHSAVESNINELEHRGLDRCPDKGKYSFYRYVGLGITSYNLHKIGRKILDEERKVFEKERKKLREAA
ncbi:MAG: ISNCY family transposase [Deltaproteobacteria bacterium]|nr:ISNCY family transposase [Deltaproteobacteria bacterium]